MRGKKARFLRQLAKASMDSDAPWAVYQQVPVKQKMRLETTPLSTITEDQRTAFKIDDAFIETLKDNQPEVEDPMVTVPVPYMVYTTMLTKDCVKFLYKRIKRAVKLNTKKGLPVPSMA